MDKAIYYIAPIFKLLLFALLLSFCLNPVQYLLQNTALGTSISQLPANYRDAIQTTSFTLVTLITLVLLGGLFKNYHFQNIFIRKKDTLKGLLLGTLLGTVLVAVCVLILYLLGAVQFIGSQPKWGVILSFLVLYAVGALFEELLFRSYAFYVFIERYPLILALLINAGLFAVTHLTNPGIGFLGFVNIGLAAVIFCLFTLHKWNISWAIGIHFGWNFSQGSIFGYSVSGTDAGGWLVAKPLGHYYLSGGSFGLEGSVVCTILLLAVIIILFYRFKLHPLATLEEEIIENDELS